MNNKGKRFLAVLAVLALAFCLIGIHVGDIQTADADSAITVTTEQELIDTAGTIDENGTIKLGHSIDFTSNLYLSKSVYLDLNGNELTITGKLWSGFTGASTPTALAKTLTIKDTSEGGTGIVKLRAVNSAYLYVNGEVKMESGAALLGPDTVSEGTYLNTIAWLGGHIGLTGKNGTERIWEGVVSFDYGTTLTDNIGSFLTVGTGQLMELSESGSNVEFSFPGHYGETADDWDFKIRASISGAVAVNKDIPSLATFKTVMPYLEDHIEIALTAGSVLTNNAVIDVGSSYIYIPASTTFVNAATGTIQTTAVEASCATYVLGSLQNAGIIKATDCDPSWTVWVDSGGTFAMTGGTVESKYCALYVDSGSATLSGGELKGLNGTAYGSLPIQLVGNSTVELSGATVTNLSTSGGDSTIMVCDTSTLTMNSGEINATSCYGVYVAGGSFTMNDGTITANVGVSTNGSDELGAVMTINGGTITSTTDAAIYQPRGTLNITGGTITGLTAIYTKCTALTITGGTITGNGTQADFKHSGNGCNVTGDAIVIENAKGQYQGAPIVDIQTGTGKAAISSTNGYEIAFYQFGTPDVDTEIKKLVLDSGVRCKIAGIEGTGTTASTVAKVFITETSGVIENYGSIKNDGVITNNGTMILGDNGFTSTGTYPLFTNPYIGLNGNIKLVNDSITAIVYPTDDISIVADSTSAGLMTYMKSSDGSTQYDLSVTESEFTGAIWAIWADDLTITKSTFGSDGSPINTGLFELDFKTAAHESPETGSDRAIFAVNVTGAVNIGGESTDKNTIYAGSSVRAICLTGLADASGAADSITISNNEIHGGANAIQANYCFDESTTLTISGNTIEEWGATTPVSADDQSVYEGYAIRILNRGADVEGGYSITGNTFIKAYDSSNLYEVGNIFKFGDGATKAVTGGITFTGNTYKSDSESSAQAIIIDGGKLATSQGTITTVDFGTYVSQKKWSNMILYGSLTIPNGSNVPVQNTVSSYAEIIDQGSINIANAGVFNVYGTFTSDVDAQTITSAGVVNLYGTMVLDNALTLNGGGKFVVGSTGVFTINGTFNVTAASNGLDVSEAVNKITVNSGAVVVDNKTAADITGKVIVNKGAMITGTGAQYWTTSEEEMITSDEKTVVEDVSGEIQESNKTDKQAIITETTVTVGSGATLTVQTTPDSTSPTEKAQIEFPAGAVIPANTVITVIAVEDQTSTDDKFEVKFEGVTIVDGTTVKVTLPYFVPSTATVQVYYVDGTNRIPMTTTTDGSSVTFETTHNSEYAVVLTYTATFSYNEDQVAVAVIDKVDKSTTVLIRPVAGYEVSSVAGADADTKVRYLGDYLYSVTISGDDTITITSAANPDKDVSVSVRGTGVSGFIVTVKSDDGQYLDGTARLYYTYSTTATVNSESVTVFVTQKADVGTVAASAEKLEYTKAVAETQSTVVSAFAVFEYSITVDDTAYTVYETSLVIIVPRVTAS